MQRDIQQLYVQIGRCLVGKKVKRMKYMVWPATCQRIGLTRNSVIFRNKCFSAKKKLTHIKVISWHWMMYIDLVSNLFFFFFFFSLSLLGVLTREDALRIKYFIQRGFRECTRLLPCFLLCCFLVLLARNRQFLIIYINILFPFKKIKLLQ